MYRLCLIAALAAALPAHAGDELARVTGTWAATSSELDGIRTGEFQVNFQAPLDTEEAIERCRRQLT